MNEQENKICKIETGDFVGSAWGSNPEWTPYARSIASHYTAQYPWFLTVPFTITAPPPSLTLPRVVFTRPLKHDVLIFGMSATQFPAPNDAATPSGTLYMQISHLENAVPWVIENQLGFAALPVFAGINTNVMPVQQMPEAFFLPAHTMLKISVLPFALDTDPTVNVKITMHGVQLINNSPGFMPPTMVDMPNGDQIPIGGRLPWFACIPYGLRPSPSNNRPFGDFILGPRKQAVQYTPPNNCTVEVHGTYASFLDTAVEFNPGNPVEVLVQKMNLTRKGDTWTPVFTPVSAAFGSILHINVSSPFPKPIRLDPGQRLQLIEQNNNTGVGTEVTRGTLSFRGVRLCEF